MTGIKNPYACYRNKWFLNSLYPKQWNVYFTVSLLVTTERSI